MSHAMSEGTKAAMDTFLASSSSGIYINIMTIGRNVSAAKEVPTSFAAELINQEIDSIFNLASESKKKVTIFEVFYSEIKKRSSAGVEWRSLKKKSKAFLTRESIIRGIQSSGAERVVVRQGSYLDIGESCVIPFSIIDLVMIRGKAVVAIESFTGGSEGPDGWHKRFATSSGLHGLSSIPVNPITISIFGDRHMIKPRPLSVRKKIVDLAKKEGWSYFTTQSSVARSLGSNAQIRPMVSDLIGGLQPIS